MNYKKLDAPIDTFQMLQAQPNEFHNVDTYNTVDKDVVSIYHFIGTEPRTIIPSFHINKYKVDIGYSKEVAPSEEISSWY